MSVSDSPVSAIQSDLFECERHREVYNAEYPIIGHGVTWPETIATVSDWIGVAAAAAFCLSFFATRVPIPSGSTFG